MLGVFVGDKRVLIVDVVFGDLVVFIIFMMVVVIVMVVVVYYDVVLCCCFSKYVRVMRGIVLLIGRIRLIVVVMRVIVNG